MVWLVITIIPFVFAVAAALCQLSLRWYTPSVKQLDRLAKRAFFYAGVPSVYVVAACDKISLLYGGSQKDIVRIRYYGWLGVLLLGAVILGLLNLFARMYPALASGL